MIKLGLMICLSVFLLINLTGCGQTGPLYLPDANKTSAKSSTTG